MKNFEAQRETFPQRERTVANGLETVFLFFGLEQLYMQSAAMHVCQQERKLFQKNVTKNTVSELYSLPHQKNRLSIFHASIKRASFIARSATYDKVRSIDALWSTMFQKDLNCTEKTKK